MRKGRFTRRIGPFMSLLVGMGVIAVPQTASARWHYHRPHAYAAGSGVYGSDYYIAVSGHRVHREVRSSSAPTGATARCDDHSWSFSENHRGTCSHHGGVARWL